MRVLATDLDRTLLPNGFARADHGAMNLFKRLLRKEDIALVFVTGRTKSLVASAIKTYNLPKPLYCISMVGTHVYSYERGVLHEVTSYHDFLRRRGNFDSKQIIDLLDFKELQLQSSRFCNAFKVSYYATSKSVVAKIHRVLKKHKIRYNLIYSYDVKRKVHLIDILHEKANKRFALEFVLGLLNVAKKNVVFAGDSGNDVAIMESGVQSIVVKNASKDVKERMKKKSNVYVACGDFKGLNGNYVSGIIEGCYHYGFFKEALK